MEEKIYLISLYDYYGELLTAKQRNYFEEYYFNNLSLKEIADNNKISRNAVFRQIKESSVKLKYYEEKLELYEKRKKINYLIEGLDEKIKNKIKKLI